jgi:hypothetical protein
MKLTIREDSDIVNFDDNANDNYILFYGYGGKNKSYFENYEDAVNAYKSCRDAYKFLYQPDKTYYLVTLSSSGFYVGHDHGYHKETLKCSALFIAKNMNQLRKFLESMKNWSRREYSKYRIYTGHYGCSPVCSKTDWRKFESELQSRYLRDKVSYRLERGFGALDISTADYYETSSIPFEVTGWH